MDRPIESIASVLKIVADESSSVAALIDARDDYRIVWANRQLKEFLKTAAVAPEGLRWGGRCPFAFGINALKAIDQVLETGKPVTMEEHPFGARVATRFGETTYWNWRILPTPTEDCPGCVLVMAENVTDRVARKAIEHSGDPHFTGVVLDLPVGVATISPQNYVILDANDIWLSYMPPDYQTRASIGKTLYECMSNFEYSGLETIIKRVVATKEVFTAREFELRDPTRGSIWWNITLRFANGGDVLLMTVWEVTEQVNARHRAESNRLRAQAMMQVQAAVSSSLALDDVLKIITDSAQNLMNSTAASVFMLSDDKQTFVPAHSSGITVTESCAIRLSSESSVAAKAIRSRNAVSLTGEEAAELDCLPGLPNDRRIVSIAAAPIEAEGEVIGVIEAYTVERRRFTNDELETLSTLASSAATAIVNARLFESASRARDEMGVQNWIVDNERRLLVAIIESLPEAVAVADAHYRLVRSNEAARGLYMAVEGEEMSLEELVVRTRPRTVDGRTMTASDHPLARAIRGEEFHSFEYIIDGPDGPAYRSVSGASVRDPYGNVIYGLTIGRDITEQKRMQVDLEQALERERRIAQTLQNALMSEVPPYLNGYKLAAVYEAGLREAEIGGDFFDIFTPEEDKVAIVIGDVAGKGLGAAIQIAAAKYGIRSYAYENAAPSHVVSKVNDVMYHDPPSGGFVTLFYAIIDVNTQEVVYSNAGHEPPLLRRANGEVERLYSNGIVLGVMPSLVFEEGTTSLCEGERLLLYTDGITEARKESGEMLGEERLTKFWSECGPTIEHPLDEVYHWARDFSEGHFHDDVAMLVISRE